MYTIHTPSGIRVVTTKRDTTIATSHKLFNYKWASYTTYNGAKAVKQQTLQVIPYKAFKRAVNAL